MQWYEQRYVNRRDWVLEHLELLGLTAQETVIVLLIDFMNDNHMDISIDALHKKSGFTETEVDQIISVLCAKKYLEIRVSSKSVAFRLDGLYSTDTAKEERVMDLPLFETFESELKRPLNQREMEKISEWNRKIDRKMILYALREASAFQKLSIPYIDSVLRSWIEKGYTAEMIEKGKVQ
ncbi:MAG: DnaD domain protein [Solobacterium sp.]|nr:DnaD domain protein [Solobacterium sp.]